MGRLRLRRQEFNKVVLRSVKEIASAFVADLKAATPQASLEVFGGADLGSGDVEDQPSGPSASSPSFAPPTGIEL